MKKNSFWKDWKDSWLGLIILIFLAVLPNLLTLCLLGVYAHRKNPMKLVKEEIK